MYIKKAKPEWIDQIAAVEAACFSPEEAASREQIAARVERFPDNFWLGFDDFGTLLLPCLRCFIPKTADPIRSKRTDVR